MLAPDLMEQFKIFLDRQGFLKEVERQKIPLDTLALLVGILMGLAKLPPSEGYEPVLVACGNNRLSHE